MGPTPYADWLIAFFDEWYSAPEQPVRVRLFEKIINLIDGGSIRGGSIGPYKVPATLVIDTDGSLHMLDLLKSAYEGATATGLNVFAHSIDEAAAYQDEFVRRFGIDKLSTTCEKCSLVSKCGGGNWIHRWNGVDFMNPSVYCADLMKLIRHIEERVAADDAKLEALDR